MIFTNAQNVKHIIYKSTISSGPKIFEIVLSYYSEGSCFYLIQTTHSVHRTTCSSHDNTENIKCTPCILQHTLQTVERSATNQTRTDI